MTLLLRFKKATAGDIWLNPAQIIYAEVGEMKDGKGKVTIVHVAGKEGKVFIKETPEEMNRIFEKHKRTATIEY